MDACITQHFITSYSFLRLVPVSHLICELFVSRSRAPALTKTQLRLSISAHVLHPAFVFYSSTRQSSQMFASTPTIDSVHFIADDVHFAFILTSDR